MKKKLLALLMVLPLVACGPTTGGDGTGSSGTGSGGEQNPPIVPPTPTPVEVKRSELLNLYEEFCTSISGEAYKATNDDWDSEYDCFYSCFEFGDKNDGYTWEDAIADAKECLPEGYVILNACHQFTWDDGSKGLEEDYIYDDKVVINVGTEEDDQGIVYVDIEVTAAENTTLIDDVGVLTKTTVLNFYDIDVQGNIYDPTPNEQLISYINSQQDEDVASSITCSKSQMMHFQQDGVNYVNIFCIGSGSTGDTVTFKVKANFAFILPIQGCKKISFKSSNVKFNASKNSLFDFIFIKYVLKTISNIH